MREQRRALRLGTRGSPLALWQARHVAGRLVAARPGLKITEVVIRTTGDNVTDRPLARIGGKGLFLKEIEEALLAGKIDLAVHSLKDVPGALPAGLLIGCVPERADPRDALCTAGPTLAELAPGARLGTSSLRRRAQLCRMRPDLRIEDLRGNVGTRLARLGEGRFDAVVLAAAGLDRLGLSGQITERLDPARLVPAVGQGALALEIREEDEQVRELLAPLGHEPTRVATGAERAVLKEFEASCQTPLAAHANLVGGEVVLDALISDLSGKRLIRRGGRAPAAEAETLGKKLAAEILGAGGREILDELLAQGAEPGEGL